MLQWHRLRWNGSEPSKCLNESLFQHMMQQLFNTPWDNQYGNTHCLTALPNKLPPAFLSYSEAMKSLDRAAQRFTSKSRFTQVESDCAFMRTLWACEKDQHCQDVLKRTHGICVFDDIMNLGYGKKHSYCTTHNRECPCAVAKNGRNSAVSSTSFINQR